MSQEYSRHLCACLMAGACLSSMANAQLGVSLAISGVVSPSSPVVEINVYVSHAPPTSWAVAVAPLELTSSEPIGFQAPTYVMEPSIMNSIPGWPFAGGYSAIAGGFYLDPGQHNLFASANPASPLLVAVVPWSTNDFTPRTVELSLALALDGLAIYFDKQSNTPTWVPGTWSATASINIVPAPASGELLAGAGIIVLRRRRRFA